MPCVLQFHFTSSTVTLLNFLFTSFTLSSSSLYVSLIAVCALLSENTISSFQYIFFPLISVKFLFFSIIFLLCRYPAIFNSQVLSPFLSINKCQISFFSSLFSFYVHILRFLIVKFYLLVLLRFLSLLILANVTE